MTLILYNNENDAFECLESIIGDWLERGGKERYDFLVKMGFYRAMTKAGYKQYRTLLKFRRFNREPNKKINKVSHKFEQVMDLLMEVDLEIGTQ